MVVHQDDYLELTLINPETNTLMHNIDFHAATGALGGGGLTEINPGEKTTLVPPWLGRLRRFWQPHPPGDKARCGRQLRQK